MFLTKAYQNFSLVNFQFSSPTFQYFPISENLFICCTNYQRVGEANYVVLITTSDMADGASEANNADFKKAKMRTW